MTENLLGTYKNRGTVYTGCPSCLFCGFFLNVFHEITGLAIQDFTQLHDGIHGYAAVVYQAIHCFRIQLIGFPQIYFFYPLLDHKRK